MSVTSEVHQLLIGHPYVAPTAQLELVEQPWLMYESTAVWRAALSGKHVLVGALVGALVSALVGALATTMMARRATAAGRIFMTTMMIDDVWLR